MAFSALVRRLLISSPGDVLDSDLAIVRKAMNRWNGLYGEEFGTAVLPISWGEHAAAQFGDHPQTIINNQLVDRCDDCIAIFANRLGTATQVAESGTAEEIERLADSGKYVAVLRCVRQIDPQKLDFEQAARLNEYLAKIGKESLVLQYSTDGELASHIDNILARMVTRDQTRAELQLQSSSVPSANIAEVWPRVDSSESARTDSRGRVQTSRNWRFVLHNTGDAPARNVRFRLDKPWLILQEGEGDDAVIPVIAPKGEVKFLMSVTMGTSPRALCTVSWEDDRGEQKNSATLRLV